MCRREAECVCVCVRLADTLADIRSEKRRLVFKIFTKHILERLLIVETGLRHMIKHVVGSIE